MADGNLTVTTLEATTFDKLRVPEAFEAAPVVAVVLPSCKYVELISSQQQRSFTYVLLEQSTAQDKPSPASSTSPRPSHGARG